MTSYCFTTFGDVLVIQPVFLCRNGIDVVVHDFAVGIFLMRSVREVEVPTVMAEAVVVGLDALPSPVLRGQFAVARIEIEMFSPSSSWNAQGKR